MAFGALTGVKPRTEAFSLDRAEEAVYGCHRRQRTTAGRSPPGARGGGWAPRYP
jgi:hypothetical protein